MYMYMYIYRTCTCTNLSLCVHNGHCICPVTYEELVVDLRQDVHAINSDVILSRESWLECVCTFSRFQIPHLCRDTVYRRRGRERAGGREEGEGMEKKEREGEGQRETQLKEMKKRSRGGEGGRGRERERKRERERETTLTPPSLLAESML